MACSPPGLSVLHYFLGFAHTHVQWVSDIIQPFRTLSSPPPPAFNLSQNQGHVQWVSSSHQVCQSIGASASASVLPMNIQDWFPLGWTWFDLLAVQGTLKSLLQHHSSKASIPWRSAIFMVQLSHLYMIIGKTIALTIHILVGKIMSLLFKMLSRFATAFLLRSKCLLISWLQSNLQ